MEQFVKVYVAILLRVDAEGKTQPVEIEWEDGRHYEITKIINKCKAPPRHVGSMPTWRYTVKIQGQTRELYYETAYNKWFVEKMLRHKA